MVGVSGEVQTYLLTAPTEMTIGPFHNIVFSLQHQLLPIHYFSIHFFALSFRLPSHSYGERVEGIGSGIGIVYHDNNGSGSMVQSNVLLSKSHEKMVEIHNNALPRYIHTQYRHREKRSVIHDDRSVATDLITESTGFQVLV